MKIAGLMGRQRFTLPFPISAPNWPGTVDRPAPQRKLGANYPTAWARRYPARLARAIVLDNLTRPAAHLLASPLVRGDEMLELVEPPVIFVANHTSHIDTPLLLSVLPVRFRHKMVVAAAADHFFDRRWKAHLWALSLAAIPIERQRVNRRSADAAADLLDEGWNLLVYPEGTRSDDGWFQEFRGGAAYLAVRCSKPVIPVHIGGTRFILPKGSRKLQRHHARVTFGAPLHARAGEDARKMGVRIEQAVAALAAEAGSDWWSARRLAHDSDAGEAVTRALSAARGPAGSPWRRAWALDGPQADHDAAEDDERRWAVERRLTR